MDTTAPIDYMEEFIKIANCQEWAGNLSNIDLLNQGTTTTEHYKFQY